VTIPAGQTSQTVNVSTINNDLVDGTAPVTITAAATGFTSGTAILTVNDDDTPALTVSLPSSTVAENSGSLNATVSVNQVLTSDRTVSISYGSADAITGPATVVIPAGQTSVSLPLTVVNGSVISGNEVVTIQVTATGVTQDSETLTVTDADGLSLTTDISSNTTVPSNGTVITQAAQFTITGITAPGATVTVDSDRDGQFDDATTTAGVDGSYSVSVPLTNNATNRGAHDLAIRAAQGTNLADTSIPVHRAVGSVYRFTTNLGTWDVELLNTAAPNTVQNFKTYADSPTAYQNLFVHRSVDNFVIQAGGFTVTGGQVSTVPTNAPIQNEFNAANSNLRGTLSMAQLGGQPDSGTSQWFVNTVDNVALNAAQHTVFGRVIGTGMTVVDAINNLTQRNLNSLYNSSALGEVPLQQFNPPNTPLTGTLSTTTGSATVTGVGTQFTSQIQAGDSLRLGSTTFFVQTVDSDTQLTLRAPAAVTLTGVTGTVDVVPNDADFVVFSDISELLAAI
jgi:cyclophilin family peptidyl-prolyl cis-trans isomerase